MELIKDFGRREGDVGGEVVGEDIDGFQSDTYYL